MRLDLHLVPKHGSEIRLPRANLYMVQAMLYSLFEKTFAASLHDVGFERENRRFKLFAFSWPKGNGRPRLEGPSIVFRAPLTLVVTSPMEKILEQIAGGFICSNDLRLGNIDLTCKDIKVYRPEVRGNSVDVKALSPITCYSTNRETGYVNYHTPLDREFSIHIDRNLRKKYEVVLPNREVPSEIVRVEPIGKFRKQPAMFRPKDTIPIVGWWGWFRLKGPQPLLQLAVDAGIGAKNSGGWGCMEAPLPVDPQ